MKSQTIPGMTGREFNDQLHILNLLGTCYCLLKLLVILETNLCTQTWADKILGPT